MALNTRLDNNNTLNLAAAWSSGLAPVTTDQLYWNGVNASNSQTLMGAAINVGGTGGGVRVGASQTNPVTINAGTAVALTLGTLGIDLSTASADLTIGSTNTVALTIAATPLNIATGRTATIRSIVSGTAFGFTKSGDGEAIFTGANTFTGAVTLNAGTLTASTVAGALGAGTLALAGGTLNLRASAADAGLSFGRNTTISAAVSIISDRLTAAGAGVTHTLGTLSVQTASAISLTAGGLVSSGTAGLTFGATTLGTNANFSLGANTLLTVGAVTGAGFTINAAGSGNLTVSGIYAGTGSGLTLAAGYTGTVTVSAINTYTGTTTINSGTLKALTSASALGTSSVVLAGGTLYFGGTAALAYSRNISVTASSTMTAARTTSGAGATYTFGTLALAAGTRLDATTDSTNWASGTMGITYGAVTLAGAATISATTDNTASLPFVVTLGAVGGEFSLTFDNVGIAGIVTLGTASTRTTSAGSTSLTNAARVRVTTASGLSTLASAPLSLASGSQLELALAAANTTFNGTAITVGAGAAGATLVLDRTTAGAAANYSYTISSLTMADGAVLSLDLGANYTSVFTATLVAPTLTLSGDATIKVVGDSVNSSQVSYAMPAVSIASGKKLTLSSETYGALSVTQTGAISGLGTLEIAGGSGANTPMPVTLSQTNTHSGGTRLGYASITATNTSAFGSGALTILDAPLGNASITAGSLTFSNSINFEGNSDLQIVAFGGSPVFSGPVSLAGTSQFSISGGTVTFSNAISGASGTMQLAISTTLSLTGTNTFGGNIAFINNSSGTLSFTSGAIPSTAAVSVSAGSAPAMSYAGATNLSLPNNISVGTASSAGLNLSSLAGAVLTLSGVISGSSVGSFIEYDFGIIRLTNSANTFAGKHYLNGGAVTLADAGAVNNPAGVVTDRFRFVNPGSALRSDVTLTLGANNGIYESVGGGGYSISAAAGTVLTIAGPLSANGSGATYTIGESTYLGTVVLNSTTSSFTSGVNVTAGATLSADSANALGSIAATANVSAAGTLIINVASGMTTSRSFTLPSGGVLSFGNKATSTLNSAGITLSGAATISGADFAQTSGSWGPSGANSVLIGANTLTVLMPTSVDAAITTVNFPGIVGTGGIVRFGSSSSSVGYGRATVASATYTGTTNVYTGSVAFTGTAPATSTITTHRNTGGGLAPRYGIVETGTGLSYTTVAAALAKITTGSTGFVAVNATSSESINLAAYTGLGLFSTATTTTVYSGTFTAATNGYLFGSYSSITSSRNAPGGSIGFQISSALSAAKPLTIAGPGVVRLSSASNSALTSITIDHGVLSAATWSTATGTGPVTITANTPYAAMWHDGSAETASRQFNINGNFTLGVGGVASVKAALTLSGAAIIGSGVALRFTGARTASNPSPSLAKWTGVISGASANGLVIGTGAAVHLTNTNTFAGGVTYDMNTPGGIGGSLRSDVLLPGVVGLFYPPNYFYVADGGAYNTVATTLGTANQYVATGSTGTLAFFANSSENIDLSTLGGGAYVTIRFGTTDGRNVTYSGTLTQATAGTQHKFSVGYGSSLTLTQTLSGTGGLSKDDHGALVFATLPTYSGNTFITRGSVDFVSAAVLPAALNTMGSNTSQTSFIRIRGGTGYDFSGHTLVNVAVVAMTASSTITPPTANVAVAAFAAGEGGVDLTVDGNIAVTTSSTLVLRNQRDAGLYTTTGTDPTGTLTINGAISGSNITVSKANVVGLTGAGTAGGRAILTQASTYSGTTSVGFNTSNAIAAGPLRVTASGALGTSVVYVYTHDSASTGRGAALELAGGVTLTNTFAAVGGFGVDGLGAIRSVSGANTITGGITAVAGIQSVAAYGADAGATLNLATLAAGTATLTQRLVGDGDIVINGAITGTNAGLARTFGSGTATLKAVCTYGGATTVDDGTLVVDKIDALSGAGTTTVSGAGRLQTSTGTTQRGRMTMLGNLTTNGGTIRLGG